MYVFRTAAPGLEPLVAAARLAGRPGRALLHSGRDDDGCGRWSFAACEPAMTIEARGPRIVVREREGDIARAFEDDPLDALAALVAAHEGAGASGGAGRGALADAPVPVAIGYLGYGLARAIDQLSPPAASRQLSPSAASRQLSPPAASRGDASVAPAPDSRDDAWPDLWFGFYDAVWRHDAHTGVCDIAAVDPDAAARLADALAARGSTPGAAVTNDADAMPGALGRVSRPRLGPLAPDHDATRYLDGVARILEYIAAGDVYQVNLARRLTAPIVHPGDPLAIYAALAALAPAPYGALIELPGGLPGGAGARALISGSPERFLHRAPGSDRVETRPIKGTRRRTGDPARDEALARELGEDDKERAEHLMIVDLERNDLGRIARVGTVTVDALGYVVALPNLYHMVSRVSARARPDVRLADILRAAFPGGSITGAPKIRAMQIIDELEPVRRGPYTGALGYIGAGGALDLAIAIRTAVVAGDRLHLHVGGGIVADSRPERELEETEEKAAGWRVALAHLAADDD